MRYCGQTAALHSCCYNSPTWTGVKRLEVKYSVARPMMRPPHRPTATQKNMCLRGGQRAGEGWVGGGSVVVGVSSLCARSAGGAVSAVACAAATPQRAKQHNSMRGASHQFLTTRSGSSEKMPVNSAGRAQMEMM